MFCFKCKVKCLFCKTKKHILGNDNIQIVARKSEPCTHWSFYLPRSSCKSIGCMTKAKVKIYHITCSEYNPVDNNIEQKESLRKKSKEGTYTTLSQISDDAN